MESGPAIAPHRVLAIDDDPVSLAVTAVFLEAEGCLVLQAQSGQEALELASTHLFDCILADLRMPGLASTELARSLRQVAPRAVLLAMSATPPEHLDGYDAVLAKPLSSDKLRAALGRRRQAPIAPPQPPADPSCDAVIDRAIFERLRHAIRREGLEEVFTVFVSDTRERIERMRNADPATVCREAHTIKGGASMLGALQVARVAALLETGIDHPDDRRRKLDEIEVACRHAELILKQRLKT